jgi:hypothetical protein
MRSFEILLVVHICMHPSSMRIDVVTRPLDCLRCTPDTNRTMLVDRFPITGPHRCSNCACVALSECPCEPWPLRPAPELIDGVHSLQHRLGALGTRATHYPTTLPSGEGAASAVPTQDAGKIGKRKLRMFAGIKSGTSEK